ncbi:hypothetical protein BDQ12DRAFT_582116, partial [Crucibulum laeve]
YAAPVSRDGFFHSGDKFYVEIKDSSSSNVHRHPRCNPESLYNFLTYEKPTGPVLTKAGTVAKRQPPEHKDEPGHFYCPQLLHYGLKPMKTKEPAKKKLLTAFQESGNRSLSMPMAIAELEKSLRDEWIQANEEAKKRHSQEKELKVIKERQQREKEKQSNLHPTEFGAFVDDSEFDPFAAIEVSDDGSPPPPVKISKTQLRKAVSEMSEERLKKLAIKWIDQIPAVEKALVDEVRTDRAAKELENKKRLKGKGKSRKNIINSTICDFSSTYKVYAPTLAEEWSDNIRGPLSFQLAPSSTSTRLWGSFDFGVIFGFIRSSSKFIATDKNLNVSFKWRGREKGEYTMSFSKSNKGTLSLIPMSDDSPYGDIFGTMDAGKFGKFEFIGRRSDGSTQIPEHRREGVRDWKYEWRNINAATHEAENTVRWGENTSFGYGNRMDGPADSDTTNDGGDSCDEDED